MSITKVGLYLSDDKDFNNVVRNSIFDALRNIGLDPSAVQIVEYGSIHYSHGFPDSMNVSVVSAYRDLKHMIYVQEPIKVIYEEFQINRYLRILTAHAYNKLLKNGIDVLIISNPLSFDAILQNNSIVQMNKDGCNIECIFYAGKEKHEEFLEHLQEFFEKGSRILREPERYDIQIQNATRTFSVLLHKLFLHKDSQDEVRLKILQKKQE